MFAPADLLILDWERKRNTRPLQMLLGRELCARGAGFVVAPPAENTAEKLEEMRSERNAWREQVQRLALSKPEPAMNVVPLAVVKGDEMSIMRLSWRFGRLEVVEPTLEDTMRRQDPIHNQRTMR